MSTNPRIYLDFNATAPMVSAARDAMIEAIQSIAGNPSSIHAEGRAARDRVERARNQVATLVGRPREQIVFTSGGSEANTVGVLGLVAAAERRGAPRVIATTRIDHPSLAGAVAGARGWEIRYLDVTADGAVVAPTSFEGVGVVAVSAVNHELGTVLDPAIVTAAHDARAIVHVDAVQAAGKLSLALYAADSLAISAHKLGGPQGVGAVATTIDDGLPVVDAGHQERGRRGGTENAIGIAGFGPAAALAVPSTWPTVAAHGDRLEAGLVALGARIHGAHAQRIGGTINAAFAGVLGESIVIALDLAGVAVSTGAACTSGSIQPSAVLLGLGQPADRAREAIRFSLGRSTTADEIDRVLALLPAIVERARRRA
jgi:cysteine desulfurase